MSVKSNQTQSKKEEEQSNQTNKKLDTIQVFFPS